MLRRRSVQFGSCGQSSLTQPREVDPGNLYPLVFGRALSLLSNSLLNFRDGTELHKRLHGFVPRHADGVHVSLDQAWHDCLAASIDHPRPITDQLCWRSARVARTASNVLITTPAVNKT